MELKLQALIMLKRLKFRAWCLMALVVCMVIGILGFDAGYLLASICFLGLFMPEH
jgi:hypothetical protein